MVDGSGRGRPRSESARAAVLHAVDNLLVEVGYAALTMKGIAERAGVGRQTVYRWWSNKAEVLYEASAIDARHELSVSSSGDPRKDLKTYLDALVTFLSRSHAGAAYRALMGKPSTTRTSPRCSPPATSSGKAPQRSWRRHGSRAAPPSRSNRRPRS